MGKVFFPITLQTRLQYDMSNNFLTVGKVTFCTVKHTTVTYTMGKVFFPIALQTELQYDMSNNFLTVG